LRMGRQTEEGRDRQTATPVQGESNSRE
jgi:hypothetical protein